MADQPLASAGLEELSCYALQGLLIRVYEKPAAIMGWL